MSEATGPGAVAQSRREALGLTRQDVSDSLNLSVRVVEAIETENWSQLPGPAFIRGYLRAYAKLLEIDGEALTGGFDANGSDGVQSIRVVGGVEPRGRGVADLLQRHPGAVLTGAVGVVICAVLVVLMAVWPQQSQTAAAASAGASDAVAHSAALVATKASADAAPTAKADAAPASSTAAAMPGGAAPAANAAVQPAPVRPGTAKDPSGARRITPTGDDRLSFAFTDDCWVEVKDAQGGTLYSDLGRSGGTLELIGHAPFRIVLGNAPAVTLLFNSERVTLAPHTRNNVGTLVLGQ